MHDCIMHHIPTHPHTHVHYCSHKRHTHTILFTHPHAYTLVHTPTCSYIVLFSHPCALLFTHTLPDMPIQFAITPIHSHSQICIYTYASIHNCTPTQLQQWINAYHMYSAKFSRSLTFVFFEDECGNTIFAHRRKWCTVWLVVAK